MGRAKRRRFTYSEPEKINQTPDAVKNIIISSKPSTFIGLKSEKTDVYSRNRVTVLFALKSSYSGFDDVIKSKYLKSSEVFYEEYGDLKFHEFLDFSLKKNMIRENIYLRRDSEGKFGISDRKRMG